MSLCIYCQQRTGKRACPALGGLICPVCCGQHRGVEINCPVSCKYFKTHESYQRARLGEEFHLLWIKETESLYKANKERVLDLIVLLEMLIYRFYREHALGTETDVAEALEFLKRRLGTIAIIETTGTALGTHLWKGLEERLQQEPLSQTEALEAVEKSLQILQIFSDAAQPRRYLHGLLGHVERHFKLPPELKESPQLIATPQIITPGS
ncbi:hypothetical protein LM602_04790 [Candidatus Acetothermia bacterium]|jgi:hypothetical protein|nr:hypothetical protein [Candidatus Acetothermia bacterium]MCI2431860.1 hypothetical protein [Candidatus Acetothermia bacterium]MCI2435973.1 hypothetical protein [Candidatus Acetothermia bacterium]